MPQPSATRPLQRCTPGIIHFPALTGLPCDASILKRSPSVPHRAPALQNRPSATSLRKIKLKVTLFEWAGHDGVLEGPSYPGTLCGWHANDRLIGGLNARIYIHLTIKQDKGAGESLNGSIAIQASTISFLRAEQGNDFTVRN